MPSTRKAFWLRKLVGNKTRDARNRRALRQLGWKALTVWECQITPAGLSRLTARIADFLEQ
jgi:DNA mismatch endonuclease (patch repair protein)